MLKLIIDRIPKGKITRDMIIPKVSTSTPEFKFACAASFLDTVSPYYEYRFAGCGYNKIKILGTKKDYEILDKCLTNILNAFYGNDKLSVLYGDASYGIGAIINNYDDDKFWERILWTQHGYIERYVDGWFNKFVLGRSDYARVEYTEVTTGQKFMLCTGILSSSIGDGYMVPNFDKFIMKL